MLLWKKHRHPQPDGKTRVVVSADYKVSEKVIDLVDELWQWPASAMVNLSGNDHEGEWYISIIWEEVWNDTDKKIMDAKQASTDEKVVKEVADKVGQMTKTQKDMLAKMIMVEALKQMQNAD